MRALILAVLLSLAASSAWAVNYCTDVNTSGAWKFDESTGDFADCTANNNSGVISGTIDYSGVVKFDGAAVFTASSNSMINFGSGTTIDNLFDGGGTFAAWVELDGAGTGGVLCSGGNIVSKGNADGWSLCVNTDGSLSFTDKWAGGTVVWTTTTAPFSAFDGTAKHVMVYYNSDSDSNDPVIKVGCSTLTVTESAAPFGARNTDAAINMLAGLDGEGTSGGELNGRLDEMIMYNGDLQSVCSAMSEAGVDGSHGGGGSGSTTGGKLIFGGPIYAEIN